MAKVIRAASRYIHTNLSLFLSISANDTRSFSLLADKLVFLHEKRFSSESEHSSSSSSTSRQSPPLPLPLPPQPLQSFIPSHQSRFSGMADAYELCIPNAGNFTNQKALGDMLRNAGVSFSKVIKQVPNAFGFVRFASEADFQRAQELIPTIEDKKGRKLSVRQVSNSRAKALDGDNYRKSKAATAGSNSSSSILGEAEGDEDRGTESNHNNDNTSGKEAGESTEGDYGSRTTTSEVMDLSNSGSNGSNSNSSNSAPSVAATISSSSSSVTRWHPPTQLKRAQQQPHQRQQQPPQRQQPRGPEGSKEEIISTEKHNNNNNNNNNNHNINNKSNTRTPATYLNKTPTTIVDVVAPWHAVPYPEQLLRKQKEMDETLCEITREIYEDVKKKFGGMKQFSRTSTTTASSSSTSYNSYNNNTKKQNVPLTQPVPDTSSTVEDTRKRSRDADGNQEEEDTADAQATTSITSTTTPPTPDVEKAKVDIPKEEKKIVSVESHAKLGKGLSSAHLEKLPEWVTQRNPADLPSRRAGGGNGASSTKPGPTAAAGTTTMTSSSTPTTPRLPPAPNASNTYIDACCPRVPIVPAPQLKGYRNKAQFTIGFDSQKVPTVGFRMGTFDTTLTVENPRGTPHLPAEILAICDACEGFVRTSPLPPFQPETNTGVWRQLTVRWAATTQEAMVDLLVTPPPTTTTLSTAVAAAETERESCDSHSMSAVDDAVTKAAPTITTITSSSSSSSSSSSDFVEPSSKRTKDDSHSESIQSSLAAETTMMMMTVPSVTTTTTTITTPHDSIHETVPINDEQVSTKLYKAELLRFNEVMRAVKFPTTTTSAAESSEKKTMNSTESSSSILSSSSSCTPSTTTTATTASTPITARVASVCYQEYTGLSLPLPNHPHIFLSGSTSVRERLCGMEFDISPGAFFQVNTPGADQLYQIVRALALEGEAGGRRILAGQRREEGTVATAAAEEEKDIAGQTSTTSNANNNNFTLASSAFVTGYIPQTRLDYSILDVCCGTGTIGLVCAPHVGNVVGVELSSEAIEDAQRNKVTNNVTNATFVCNKAEAVMKDILSLVMSSNNTVNTTANTTATEPSTLSSSSTAAAAPSNTRLVVGIVDPPRGGLHGDVIKAMRTCKTLKRIVYVSCNPRGSLVTDAVRLSIMQNSTYARGPEFRPVLAIPVDLFPHTPHCEMVMLFERD